MTRPASCRRRPGCCGCLSVSGWSGPSLASRTLERLLVQRDRLRQPAGQPVGDGQVVAALERVGVVGTQRGLADGAGLRMQAHGLVVQAQAPVGRAQRVEQRPLGRLASPANSWSSRVAGPVQDVGHLHLPAVLRGSGCGSVTPAPGTALTASACCRDSSDCSSAACVLACTPAWRREPRRSVRRPTGGGRWPSPARLATAPSPTTPAASATAAAATAVRCRRTHRRARAETGSRQAVTGSSASHLVDIVGQGARRGIAVLGPRRQRLEADRLQGPRQARVPLARRHDRRLAHRLEPVRAPRSSPRRRPTSPSGSRRGSGPG